jgi:hypothetical protein
MKKIIYSRVLSNEQRSEEFFFNLTRRYRVKKIEKCYNTSYRVKKEKKSSKALKHHT